MLFCFTNPVRPELQIRPSAAEVEPLRLMK